MAAVADDCLCVYIYLSMQHTAKAAGRFGNIYLSMQHTAKAAGRFGSH